jgi:uncharacterized membrane protein
VSKKPSRQRQAQLANRTRDVAAQQTSLRIQHAEFSGPLPPAQMLAQYDDVQRGLAERIVVMAEMEGNARRANEAKIIEAVIASRRRGQFFALAIGVGTLAVAAFAASKGLEWTAGTAVASIAGIAGVFIWQEQRSKANSEDAGDDS